MSPRARQGAVLVASSVLAIFLGFGISRGLGAWSVLLLLVAAIAIATRLTALTLDVLVLGAVVVGYLVANRGFAQLAAVSSLPLFPAEIALGIGGTWLLVASAVDRELPIRRDALNLAVLLWLAIGTVRVVFDVPRFGFLALRDFAMVYYAVFFFVAQRMARAPDARRFLERCLLAGFGLLPLSYALSQRFPEVFLDHLTVRGLPLIFFKDDLAGTFLAAGSLALFFSASGRRRFWAWPLSAVLFLSVIAGENRASMLGLALATLLLVGARRWQFPAWQAGATALAAAVVFAAAVFAQSTWAEKELKGVTDRLTSLADLRGTGVYETAENANKGDNNRFRWVWWRNVVGETAEANPVFGLGFGADLAHGFVQEYYPVTEEEFTTRSPHNFFVTTFGRMGALGVAAWGMVVALIVGTTWRRLRTGSDPLDQADGCILCVILVSSCLGVVLEGPMAAVAFWTLLGLWHGRQVAGTSAAASTAGEPAAAAVRSTTA